MNNPETTPPNSNQLRYGTYSLAGPKKNALKFTSTPTGASQWEVLEAIVEDWIKDAAEYHIANPADFPVLFLVGRATENGGVDRNLRLTEQRATAVRSMIIASTNPKVLHEAGLSPDERFTKDGYSIIAIGEGESVLAPASMITHTGNRRVDAYLCKAPAKQTRTTQR